MSDLFTISGRVIEKDSGIGVPNLRVRAYDEDLIYDDLLGTAITDAEGGFEITYTKRDFSELFEARPDIYLSVYAPPMRRLPTEEASIVWDTDVHTESLISISRDALGPLSPSIPETQVWGQLRLDHEALVVDAIDRFHRPRIDGFITTGEPGAPALPVDTYHVLLPAGARFAGFEVDEGRPIALEGPFDLLPAQRPTPDIGTDPRQFSDGFSIENVGYDATLPDARIYDGKELYPANLVELISTERTGPAEALKVRVCPVRYDPRGRSLLFYPDLRFVVEFEPGDAEPERVTVGYAEVAERVLQSDHVLTAKDIAGLLKLIPEDFAHVIITDNYAWPESITVDGASAAPTVADRGAPLGDLVGEFERLARWKSERGRRSRVVTITDIVQGTFGDLTNNGFAVDLQEVIRNFIKLVRMEWGTSYVLLGGDVQVVPMRKLTGSSLYKTIGCYPTSSNPPERERAHLLANQDVVKLYPLFIPQTTNPMSTYHGGAVVPFDRQAGPNQLGWYYTTESDFTTLDIGFTRLPAGQTSPYVIVEGPRSVIDDFYYWVRDVNLIPSDFYYASLVGAGYDVAGRHDFDANGNGLYGQYHWHEGADRTLDDVDNWSDIWVGRASVDTVAQAAAFVDKVIAYEKLELSDGTALDEMYLGKILYGADCWKRDTHTRQADTTTPPAEARYTHITGEDVSKLHLRSDIGISTHQLIARHSGADMVISYSVGGGAGTIAWRFATDDTFSATSTMPTRFVIVQGPEADLTPDLFFWDPIGMEKAIDEKETLRKRMDGWFSDFQTIDRHYADYFEVQAPPPIHELESATIQAAIDQGVHFLSMSGHGNPGGCCGVSKSHDFTNTGEYFIGYADSCTTARPDGTDSLAEFSLFDADGGAVAYVGYTRYGWIGTGAKFEDAFWRKLMVFDRAGPAAGYRGAAGLSSLWTVYGQNLFGDPEMPVWTSHPKHLDVMHPAEVARGSMLQLTVLESGLKLTGAQVTVMGGWSESKTRPDLYSTKVTEAAGTASFPIPSTLDSVAEVQVTVTKLGFKPYTATIPLTTA